MRAIPECLRGVFTTRRYTNLCLSLPYLYHSPTPSTAVASKLLNWLVLGVFDNTALLAACYSAYVLVLFVSVSLCKQNCSKSCG